MKVSVRLDDISPLIQYTGAWRAGSQEDALFSRYSDGGTFMLTQSNDAFATIRFPGTRISVFGAKRGNHNNFTVAVDSDPKEVYSGNPDGDEEFQVPLFTSAVLPGSTDKLVVQDASTNADQPFLDIDYVEIEAEIEGSDSLRIETDAPFWTYDPPSSWDVASAHAESNSSSSHLTTEAGSSATISFSGAAVDLYGLVCSQCGTYWVSLDGGPVETFNAFNAAWTRSQTLLYMARDLEDAEHTLTVTNLGYPASAALTLDYVTVYGNDPKGVIRSVAKTKSNEAVRTLAAVLGGMLAGVLLLLVGALHLCLQRRRRRWSFKNPAATPSTTSPTLRIYTSPFATAQSSADTSRSQPARHPFAAPSILRSPAPPEYRESPPTPNLIPGPSEK